jgi:hypothetical protein
VRRLWAQDGARAFLKTVSGSWKQVQGSNDFDLLKVEPESGGVKMSFGCKQDGLCTNVIVGGYDGKPYKDIAAFTRSFRKTGDRAMQEDDYSSGKLGGTVSWQLSSDGNTLTRTGHRIIPPAPKDVRYVYDRSEGPVSHDDPFVGFWKRNWGNSDVLITTFSSKGDVLMQVNPNGATVERNCDGKDHPTRADPALVYSCRFSSPSSYEGTYKERGTPYIFFSSRLADDGKKLVEIRKDAEGKTRLELTFEKVD